MMLGVQIVAKQARISERSFGYFCRGQSRRHGTRRPYARRSNRRSGAAQRGTCRANGELFCRTVLVAVGDVGHG